jgi:hypothetical protein
LRIQLRRPTSPDPKSQKPEPTLMARASFSGPERKEFEPRVPCPVQVTLIDTEERPSVLAERLARAEKRGLSLAFCQLY